MTRDALALPEDPIDALALLDDLLDDLAPKPGSRAWLGGLLDNAYRAQDDEIWYEDPHNAGLPTTKGELRRVFFEQARLLTHALHRAIDGADDWDPDIMGQMTRTMMYAASYLDRGANGEWT